MSDATKLVTADGVAVKPDHLVWRHDAEDSAPAGEIGPKDLDRWFSTERAAIEDMIWYLEANIAYESGRIYDMQDGVNEMSDRLAKFQSRLAALPT